MDRSVFEGDPHSVLEGMMLGGYAIGADKGYVYIRAEYPIALMRLREAIQQAKDVGILGKTSSARTLISTSRSGSAPARSSAARRRR